MAKVTYKVLGEDHHIFKISWIVSTHKTSGKVMDQDKNISRKDKAMKTKK